MKKLFSFGKKKDKKLKGEAAKDTSGARAAPPVNTPPVDNSALSYRDRIINMCLKYKPEKVVLVDQMMLRYRNREKDLLQTLVKSSGPEPSAEEVAQLRQIHGLTALNAPAASTQETTGRSHRDRILAIALKHNPSKVVVVDAMLAQFKGREEQLIRSLVQNHGPEPSDEEFEALKAAAAARGQTLPIAQESAASTVATERAQPDSVRTSSANPSAPNGLTHRQRLINICLKYKPSKVETVDSMLQHFKGHEEELIQSLVRGYGPEPTAEEIANLTTGHRRKSTDGAALNVSEQPSQDVVAPVTQSTADIISHGAAEQGIPADSNTSAEENVVPQGSVEVYRERLLRLYTKYNPSKVESLDRILQSCKGSEENVIQTLIRKYGPEPTAEEYQELLNAQANQQQSTEELPQPTDVEVNTDSEEPQKKVPVGAVPTVFAVAKNQMAHSTPALTPVVDIQPTNKPTRAQYEQRLRNFYTKYSRSKIPFCSQELDKYQDKEEELFQTLVNIYGPEPTDVELACMVRPTSARIIFLCMKHDPSRLETIARELVAYKGREEALLQSLVESYGEEPSDEEIERLISSGATSKLDIRSRVKYLIMKNCPENVNDVDQIMQAHDGNDVLLLRELIIKYGPEPSMSEIQAFEAPNTPRRVSKMSPILFRQRLHNMFSVYRPDAIGEIASYMTRYAGREEELMHELVEAHGPEPTDEQVRVAREKLAENAAPPKSQVDFRTRLTNFYLKHCPSRLQDIDTILSKCVGMEEQLMEELVAKYGPEPSEKEIEQFRYQRVNSSNSMNASANRDYRTIVMNYYLVHDPENMKRIDEVLSQFVGNEEELIRSLFLKYGPEPNAAQVEVAKSQARANIAAVQARYRARVLAFFAKYDTTKESTIDAVMLEYADREEDLIKNLLARYGPEPTSAVQPESIQIFKQKPPTSTYRRRIQAMYQKYDPEMLGSVDIVLAQYIGKEDELMQTLIARYGPEPASFNTPTSSIPVSSEKLSLRTRLIHIFMRYDPENLPSVDATLAQYIGNEEQMIRDLVAKYGPEPTIAEVAWHTYTNTGSPRASEQHHDTDVRSRMQQFAVKYDPEIIETLNKMFSQYAEQIEKKITSLTHQTEVKTPAPVESAKTQDKKDDYRRRASNFLTKYDPSRLLALPEMMKYFDGQEDEMIRTLLVQYGPEPTDAEIAALQFSNHALEKSDYRARVVRFYTKYDPDKLPNVDAILASFAGREAEMIRSFLVRYGAEPTEEEIHRLKDPSSKQSYRERVLNFLYVYDPKKIDAVDSMLSSFRGEEERLLRTLQVKYGPEPTPEDVITAQSKLVDCSGSIHPGESEISVPIVVTVDVMQEDYQARLINFFSMYNPELIATVPQLLASYKSREEDLLQHLVSQYGPEPTQEEIDFLNENILNNFFGDSAVLNYSARVCNIFQHYDPVNQRLVESVLKNYEGQEDQMMRDLVLRYGPEPLEEYEGGRFVQTYNMYHQRLTRFLAHYDPEKLCEIDAELSCHLGQEEELMMSLTQIYGPESYSDELQPQGLTLPSISALFPKIGANDASLGGYKATARQQSFYV